MQILSPESRNLWHEIETSIWRPIAEVRDDPVRSILQTLFDQPRWIQPRFLYDSRGSKLFEKICSLPEYYLTRTEDSILDQESKEIISLAPVECIVELGAGFSRKTIHLLREQLGQRKQGVFAPIDVSLTALIESRNTIQQEFPRLSFQGLCARYEEAVPLTDKNVPTLFAFLGSSVGNFNQVLFSLFFDLLSRSMGRGDFLLLGVDCIKDPGILERAYNDSLGITAEFILNAFSHLNQICGSNFDPGEIRYEGHYNPFMQRMEMYAVPTCDQPIRLNHEGASFTWKEDEPILVEISRKFDPDRLEDQLRFFGLEPVAQFADADRWFSLLLLKKGGGP